MKRTLFISFFIAASIGLFSISVPAQQSDLSPKKTSSGLPGTLSAFGNSYVIEKYKLWYRSDSPGDYAVDIILSGQGFDKIPPDGKSPFLCDFMLEGNPFSRTGTGIVKRNIVNGVPKSVEFTCTFSTFVRPDTLVIYARDNHGQAVKIQVPPKEPAGK